MEKGKLCDAVRPPPHSDLTMSENQIRARVVGNRDGGGGGIAQAMTSMGRVKVSGFGGDYSPPTVGGK
jgi:hypothetical protein